MTKILNSKELYEEKLENLKLHNSGKKLAVVRAAEDVGSTAYLNGIKKTAEKIETEVLVFDVDAENIFSEIEKLNSDESIGGILVFRPLPDSIDEERLNNLINPQKDVDCMNPINKAKIYSGDVTGFVPLAPKAAMELLDFYCIDVKSKNCLIINHSNVVGKPLAMLLLNRFATVEIAHVMTKDLKEHSKRADIIFSAVGKSEFLDESYFSKDAIVIDIGIARNSLGKLTGDLNKNSVDGKIAAYSPVPNGVGSLTNLLLLESAIK